MFPKNKTKAHKEKQHSSQAFQEYLNVQHKKYQVLCEQNNISNQRKDACYYLGLFHETVRNCEKNMSLAGHYYEIGCERDKSGTSCLKLGEFVQNGRGGFPRDEERAGLAFEKACEYGNGVGCYLSGLSLTPWSGKQMTRWRVAEKRFIQGCALNDPQSCDALSAMYRRGLIPAKKKMIFAKSYSSVAELVSLKSNIMSDNQDGEVNLLLLLKNREKLAEHCRKAIGLSKEANFQDDSEFEGKLSVVLDSIPKMTIGDAFDLSFGCLNGKIQNPELCHRMSEWMMLRNMDVGCLMYDQSCNTGSKQSCLQLGNIFMEGFPVFPKDQERAAEAFERACELDSAQGCYQAGIMRHSGEYQCKKRESSAKSLLIKGCSLNHEESCVQLSALYRRYKDNLSNEKNLALLGRFSWRNRFQVHSADKRTCELGKFEACAKLSEFCKQEIRHPLEGTKNRNT